MAFTYLGAFFLGQSIGSFVGQQSNKKMPEFMSFIPMSGRAKGLEQKLYESLSPEKDVFPENLASRFRGDAIKILQARKRATEGAFSKATVKGSDNVVSGDVVKGILSESAERLNLAGAGEAKVGQARRLHSMNRLKNMQNFINLQSNIPLLSAQQQLLKGDIKQYQSAEEGAGIGNIAQVGALSAFGGFGGKGK